MSQAARDALVANAKISFTDSSQASDFQNENVTNSYLIALLQWQLDNCIEPIEILSVRTDHQTPDGPWAHSGGMAVDFYPKNWAGREEEAVTACMKALSENPYCEAVGLGGMTWNWVSYVTWPSGANSWWVVFQDNDKDHLHAGCANATAPPGARSNAGGGG